MNQKRTKTIIRITMAAILLVAIVTAGYFAKSYYDLKSNPNKVAEGETERLTTAVGKLYQLPRDETPIVGKVQDKDKLQDQPFFKNAKNGDSIIIYQKTKVAIVYRASENKLINVGPIAMDAAPKQNKRP